MNKEKCVICTKPMGNSQSEFNGLSIHVKCQTEANLKLALEKIVERDAKRFIEKNKELMKKLGK